MDKPTLPERYAGLLGGLQSAQETLANITKMAKELVEVGEKNRDKMLKRIQDFLEENYMDMVKGFLGDARAVLMVNYPPPKSVELLVLPSIPSLA